MCRLYLSVSFPLYHIRIEFRSLFFLWWHWLDRKPGSHSQQLNQCRISGLFVMTFRFLMVLSTVNTTSMFLHSLSCKHITTSNCLCWFYPSYVGGWFATCLYAWHILPRSCIFRYEYTEYILTERSAILHVKHSFSDQWTLFIRFKSSNPNFHSSTDVCIVLI